MFRFGSQQFLALYVLIPALAVFLAFAFRRRAMLLARFGDLELVQKLSRSLSRRLRQWKVALMLVAIALLVTALARPQFGTRVETMRREGQDVIVALDLSASMRAEDIAPNRLEKAKLAVSSLIDRLAGDRIGLVAFAGDAFVQSPLTVDYAAAKLFLNAMRTDLIPVPGTDVGRALVRALDAFPEGQRQHKVVVLITDGEDHEGDIAEQIDRAIDEGVIVHTVGIGSPDGVPIPEFDAEGRRRGFKKDELGEVVLTRLDEATLQGIARRTGGNYYRATVGQNELDLLADEIAGMEARELDAQQFTQFDEQFQIFLGLALLVLLTESVIPERRRDVTAWSGRFQ